MAFVRDLPSFPWFKRPGWGNRPVERRFPWAIRPETEASVRSSQGSEAARLSPFLTVRANVPGGGG
jgi:hypothetical protein